MCGGEGPVRQVASVQIHYMDGSYMNLNMNLDSKYRMKHMYEINRILCENEHELLRKEAEGA